MYRGLDNRFFGYVVIISVIGIDEVCWHGLRNLSKLCYAVLGKKQIATILIPQYLIGIQKSKILKGITGHARFRINIARYV